MIKVLVNNEEVVCDNKIEIKEEMLSTSSTILKNCYPKTWEDSKDYVSNFYFPKDYSKCKIIGGQQTRTGTDFSFRNSDNYFDYKLLGETGGTTGYQNIKICDKNLLNIPDGTYSHNGVTAVVSNGEITLNGTASATSFIAIPLNIKFIANENYILSVNNSTGIGNNTYWAGIRFTYNNTSSNPLMFTNVNATRTYTFNETITTTDLTIRTNSGISYTDYVIKPQLEKGSTATTYEAYLGNTYEINLGKNLLDSTQESYTLPANTTNYQKIWNTKPYLEAGTKYYISYNIDNASSSNTKSTPRLYLNQQYVQSSQTNQNLTTGRKVWEFTPTVSGNYEVQYWLQGSNVDVTVSKFMISKSSDTTYAPYFTPIVLNEGDYIYKDETWKTYINGTSTDITRDELITELNAVQLRQGLNNISSTAPLEIITSQLIFCGCVKNTGNISLNPREPHYVDLQILDFKTLLSEGETLNYVITDKTIVEAINQVVSSISDYGFVVGNIELLTPNDKINAYSTLNKTAYDVFQYIADITQSKWTTRMIDENTIAIDFYDPTLMPQASPIESTQSYFEQNDIEDISFNYSTNDYRNKQIMTSDEVFANITQTETLIADGYRDSFMCQNKIGIIEKITVNGVEKTFATKSEEELGVSADFIYQPGEMTFNANTTYSAGAVIVITYYAIVKGREIILNTTESTRVSNQIGRKGTISRYENRNDTTSSQELIKIGQSYIKYKGSAEITLKVISGKDLFEVGQIVNYDAPLEELSTDYMVKSKTIDMYLNAGEIFYTYELSSNFNSENAINYFDNQRAKNQGNIGEGETITRNIDLESTALIQFYDTNVEEIVVSNPTSLDFGLDGVLI